MCRSRLSIYYVIGFPISCTRRDLRMRGHSPAYQGSWFSHRRLWPGLPGRILQRFCNRRGSCICNIACLSDKRTRAATACSSVQLLCRRTAVVVPIKAPRLTTMRRRKAASRRCGMTDEIQAVNTQQATSALQYLWAIAA